MGKCKFLLKHFLQSGLSRDFLVSGPLPASARPRWRQLEVGQFSQYHCLIEKPFQFFMVWRVVCLLSRLWMSAVWLAGFDFSSRFLSPSGVASVETHADVRGPQKHPTLKAKLTSRLGSLAVLIAYLLECKKRCKVENYRGGDSPSPQEETPFTKPTGFCYRGRLGNGAACWVGCFYGFSESNWKRQRRFILVSGKTGPVQHKRWFLKKDRNDSRMLVPVLQDHCRYFNFNILFDDNLKCPFVCDLYYMIHLIL